MLKIIILLFEYYGDNFLLNICSLPLPPSMRGNDVVENEKDNENMFPPLRKESYGPNRHIKSI